MKDSLDLMEIWNRQDLTDLQKRAFDTLSDAVFYALKDLSGDDPIRYFCRRKNSFEDFLNYHLECDIQIVKYQLRNEI